MTTARKLLPALSLVAFVFVGSAVASSGGSIAQQDLVFAEEEQIVEPWQVSTVEHREGTVLRSRRPDRPIPEGVPVDEATMRRLRADARVPRLRGRAMGMHTDAGPPSGAPKNRSDFDGLDAADGGFFFPPDTQIAAGPDHVLQAVNSALRLSDKKGKNAVMQTGTEHFGLSDDLFLFDPKTHYDPISGRFFIVFLESDFKKTSFAWVSVSRSDSPGGLTDADWCHYRVKTKKGKTWADYPGLGTNEQWLAISTNHFKFVGGYSQAYWFVADKAALVDNAASCPSAKFSRLSLKKDSGGTFVFTAQPAQHLSETGISGSPLYGLASHFANFDTEYALYSLVDKNARGAPKPALSNEIIEGSGYAMPPNAMQKDGNEELDSGDVRMMQQLVYVDGQLWGVHASGCFFDSDPDTTVSCIRVVRVRPDSANPTIDYEDLFGEPQQFLWWPGLAVAGNGDVVAAFQIGGTKHNLSTGFNGLKKGAARFGAMRSFAEFFDGLKISGEGTCAPEQLGDGDTGRTGDYVGVVSDPDSSRDVWVSGEHGQQVGSDCRWGTTIARVSY